MGVDWVPVDSSVFNAVAYDDRRWHLYLRFHTGKIYRYLEFPQEQYDELLGAESKGRYFADRIREDFGYELVGDGERIRRPARSAGR